MLGLVVELELVVVLVPVEEPLPVEPEFVAGVGVEPPREEGGAVAMPPTPPVIGPPSPPCHKD